MCIQWDYCMFVQSHSPIVHRPSANFFECVLISLAIRWFDSSSPHWSDSDGIRIHSHSIRSLRRRRRQRQRRQQPYECVPSVWSGTRSLPLSVHAPIQRQTSNPYVKLRTSLKRTAVCSTTRAVVLVLLVTIKIKERHAQTLRERITLFVWNPSISCWNWNRRKRRRSGRELRAKSINSTNKKKSDFFE